ncbi:phosphoglucomutase/phosphomannomutase family protein [Citrifermentans bemidjiense Bem]|uniref:Phosphoglucomutase/phosphomannomutase family protein n=1 Tax=Citrifermentans bemidjiense (strain ATCC BAA-1014 / DSM 16622 / JCM 12645 / Bem) TaxID=404380 RepID=B5EG43_CITBB|nr:phosphoglucomutase/phosphomannomutase family protein [Citrifermentans bemidjiense]ACH40956.1 phosphoglucomutase/phosphomannomutase family protein [Citrifermentans bemidjiense Bem]
MQIQFGTDGWRGVIADTFTFENLSLVAQATMDYLHEQGVAQKGLVIGYDRRFLSREFAERVAGIAAANGIATRLSESYAPTPAVSWAVHEGGAGAGIMITASHNPPCYNGFKVKEGFGGSARPSTTKVLEQMVARNMAEKRPVQAVTLAEGLESGKIAYFDACAPYLAQLARYVDLELIRSSGIKAVVDPMFGAGCGLLPRLLPGVVEIHGSENPAFGGHPPEPIAEHLGELSQVVADGFFQVGLALDGDADRIGAVDERGKYFSSHRIFTVLLRHLYERKGLRGGVVKTVSTTQMIDRLAEKYGLQIFETPIGFKHICEVMLEHDILMGGEESGGLGVKGHIPERDGILMALLLLEAMAMSGKGLRALLEETMEEIGHFHYRRIDVPISAAAKQQLLERLRGDAVDVIAGHRVAATNFSDGFKYILEDGAWLLIRLSGTEPVLRLYSEAREPDLVARLLEAAKRVAGV